MKNKDGRSLQKEFEFYTNLLAEHEKKKIAKCSSSHGSLSNRQTKKLHTEFAVMNAAAKPFFNSFNTVNLKHSKMIHSSDKLKNVMQKKALPSSISQSSYSFSNVKKNFFVNESVKDFSLKSTNNLVHSSQSLNSVTYKNSSITQTANQHFSSQLVSKESCTKSDSQKLMGEIVAITKQLKLKSENLGLPAKNKNLCLKLQNLNSVKKNKSFKYYNKSIHSLSSRVVKKKDSESYKHQTKPSIDTTNMGIKNQFICKTKSALKELNSKITQVKSENLKLLKIEKVKENPSVEMNIESKTKLKPKRFVSNQNTSPRYSIKKNHIIVEKKSTASQCLKLNQIIPNHSLQTGRNCLVLNKFLSAKKTTSKSAKLSKYKIINKELLTNSNPVKCNTTVPKTKKYRSNSSMRKRNMSSYKLVRATYTPKNSAYKYVNVSNKSMNNLTSKYHCNKASISCNKNSKTVLSNTNNHVDIDLVRELVEENENYRKQIFSNRVYKTKSVVINNYSAQIRKAKSIKLKYLTSFKSPGKWRNSFTGINNYKSFSRKYTYKSQDIRNKTKRNNYLSLRNFPKTLHGRKSNTQKKKIVYLDGKKFIVGSAGKTLMKLTKQSSVDTVKYKNRFFKTHSLIKTKSPVTKKLASQVLNRSINRVLSASSKKKMQKVNTYCMFYNRFGKCNKGVKCQFVHDPSKIAVCTRFLRGTCKKDKCYFSHEICPGKIAVCSFFLQDACTNKNCPYRHEKLSADAELCKAFLQGYCSSGKECKKAHLLICPKFIHGICDKGSKCMFPHPVGKEKKQRCKAVEKSKQADNHLSEVSNRYFESSSEESVTKGLVVPRIKSLPEQPSFISLSLEETS